MHGSQEMCMLEEYMTGDSDLAVCKDIHGENWQETFLEQIGQSETEEKDDEDMNDDYRPMQVKTYQEAIRALEDAQKFLLSRGHMKEAMNIGCSVDSVVALHLNTQKQSTLDHYFIQ